MVTVFAFMAMRAKSESRSVVIVTVLQAKYGSSEWEKTTSLPPCSPWAKQREFLEVLSGGSSSETAHFQKMTAMASDGPTSKAVLDQVPLFLQT